MHPTRRDGYEVEALGDELMLYDPSGERVMYMNGPCAAIWSLCDGTRSAREVIQVLAEAYPEAKEQIPADVENALATLRKEGALIDAPSA